MSRNRVFAVLLLLIAFATLAASKAAPFLRDVSGAVMAAIVVAGVVCGPACRIHALSTRWTKSTASLGS